MSIEIDIEQAKKEIEQSLKGLFGEINAAVTNVPQHIGNGIYTLSINSTDMASPSVSVTNGPPADANAAASSIVINTTGSSGAGGSSGTGLVVVGGGSTGSGSGVGNGIITTTGGNGWIEFPNYGVMPIPGYGKIEPVKEDAEVGDMDVSTDLGSLVMWDGSTWRPLIKLSTLEEMFEKFKANGQKELSDLKRFSNLDLEETDELPQDLQNELLVQAFKLKLYKLLAEHKDK